VVALVSSVAMALPGTAGAAAPTWHTLPLPGTGTDYNASTAYNGQLHVFTYDPTNGLGQDWWDGQRWNFSILDGPGSLEPGHTTDGVGMYNSVTVYNGQLHVFTADATTGSLRQDWWDGQRWNFSILDGPGSLEPGHTTDRVGMYNSVTVYNGQLHVFTWDFTTGSLRQDWWDGRRWNFETLDGVGSVYPGHSADNVGPGTAVVVYSGQLHVFTDDATTGSLRQDWWDGRRWNFGILETFGGDVDLASTSAVVYGTQLHVFTTVNNGLADYWWDGVGWHVGFLDVATGCIITPSCPFADVFGASIAATVYNGQLQVFSNGLAYTLGLTQYPAWLQHDWWDGTRWHHTKQLSGYNASADPNNAVTVYNGQLHLFTDTSGLDDVWWG
jgi:hypothetical protein